MAYASARLFPNASFPKLEEVRAIGHAYANKEEIAYLHIIPRDKGHAGAIAPVVSESLFSNDMVAYNKETGIIEALIPVRDRAGSALATSRVVARLAQEFGEDAPFTGFDIYQPAKELDKNIRHNARNAAKTARNRQIDFFTDYNGKYARQYSVDPTHPKIETTISEEVRLALYILRNLEKAEAHYQFKVRGNGKRKSVGGVEVLLRMRHPEEERYLNTGLITQFAASTDLLIPLDNAVREKALAEIKEWLKVVNLPASFNYSPKELNSESASALAKMVTKEGVDLSKIGIEVLESSDGKDKREPDELLQYLTNFYKSGFTDIAFDDALSGDGAHSTLEALASIPFTTIKLDRGQMVKLDQNNYRVIAEGVAWITKRLTPVNPSKWGGVNKEIKRKVVAEGVPPEWLNWAARRVDYIQSFATHRPEPIDKILEHIAKSKKTSSRFKFQRLR